MHCISHGYTSLHRGRYSIYPIDIDIYNIDINIASTAGPPQGYRGGGGVYPPYTMRMGGVGVATLYHIYCACSLLYVYSCPCVSSGSGPCNVPRRCWSGRTSCLRWTWSSWAESSGSASSERASRSRSSWWPVTWRRCSGARRRLSSCRPCWRSEGRRRFTKSRRRRKRGCAWRSGWQEPRAGS